MTTAWIFPGGGTFGAIQAGIVTALLDCGEKPDLVLGTSIGSLTATWMSAYPTPSGAASLRDVWLGMRRKDVFPIQPGRILRARLGLSNHAMSNTALLRWMSRTMPSPRLEDGLVPLTVTATDVASEEAVYLDRGPLLPALLASCAMPGMFPPVEWDGRWLLDGGIAADAPISQGVAQGADRVFLISCGGTEPFSQTSRRHHFVRHRSRADQTPPRSPLGIAGWAVNTAIIASTRLELELNAPRCELYVVPAPSVDGLSLMSFDESRGLMRAAESLAREWIRSPAGTGGREPARQRRAVSALAADVAAALG